MARHNVQFCHREGSEQTEKLSYEVGKRRRLFELELFEHHALTREIHHHLAQPAYLVAVRPDWYIIEDTVDVQSAGLVVSDEVEAYEEEKEKEGLQFIGNLVALVGKQESQSRDEMPSTLEKTVSSGFDRKTNTKVSPRLFLFSTHNMWAVHRQS